MSDPLVPPLMKVRNLSKSFPVKQGFLSPQKTLYAVRNVSFEIFSGETLGLVGESGCGKSTVARVLVRLYPKENGQVIFEGREDDQVFDQNNKDYYQKVQMIFQDPYSSLNPRMRIGESIAEPLAIHTSLSKAERRGRVEALLQKVGLRPEYYDRYPHEFSGGQRQRVGIARAIALTPKLIVADEPVSALDVSVSAQIVNLLQDLQQQEGMSYLFISHDLKMVKYLSHRIAVMYLGQIVEMGPKENFEKPLHPYTQALMAAVPVVDLSKKEKKLVLSGEIPSPLSPPAGCSFHPRCPFAEEKCRQLEPALKEWKPGHWAACHRIEGIEELQNV